MINSLKASIPFLADILRLNPHAIYERQRALVKQKVLKSLPGRGPGSGTFFTPEPVGVLVTSMLTTENIKDSAEKTSAMWNAPRTSYSSGKKNALGGALTFKEAMINVLSSDGHALEVQIIRVHRTNLSAELFLVGGGHLEFKSDKASKTYDFDGMTGFYQIMGGPGGLGAIAEIRALLRDNEKAANENIAPTKAPAKKRFALRKG
jgi:hypothetical protein